MLKKCGVRPSNDQWNFRGPVSNDSKSKKRNKKKAQHTRQLEKASYIGKVIGERYHMDGESPNWETLPKKLSIDD